jgi:hypothetical protein
MEDQLTRATEQVTGGILGIIGAELDYAATVAVLLKD